MAGCFFNSFLLGVVCLLLATASRVDEDEEDADALVDDLMGMSSVINDDKQHIDRGKRWTHLSSEMNDDPREDDYSRENDDEVTRDRRDADFSDLMTQNGDIDAVHSDGDDLMGDGLNVEKRALKDKKKLEEHEVVTTSETHVESAAGTYIPKDKLLATKYSKRSSSTDGGAAEAYDVTQESHTSVQSHDPINPQSVGRPVVKQEDIPQGSIGQTLAELGASYTKPYLFVRPTKSLPHAGNHPRKSGYMKTASTRSISPTPPTSPIKRWTKKSKKAKHEKHSKRKKVHYKNKERNHPNKKSRNHKKNAKNTLRIHHKVTPIASKYKDSSNRLRVKSHPRSAKFSDDSDDLMMGDPVAERSLYAGGHIGDLFKDVESKKNSTGGEDERDGKEDENDREMVQDNANRKPDIILGSHHPTTTRDTIPTRENTTNATSLLTPEDGELSKIFGSIEKSRSRKLTETSIRKMHEEVKKNQILDGRGEEENLMRSDHSLKGQSKKKDERRVFKKFQPVSPTERIRRRLQKLLKTQQHKSDSHDLLHDELENAVPSKHGSRGGKKTFQEKLAQMEKLESMLSDANEKKVPKDFMHEMEPGLRLIVWSELVKKKEKELKKLKKEVAEEKKLRKNIVPIVNINVEKAPELPRRIPSKSTKPTKHSHTAKKKHFTKKKPNVAQHHANKTMPAGNTNHIKYLKKHLAGARSLRTLISRTLIKHCKTTGEKLFQAFVAMDKALGRAEAIAQDIGEKFHINYEHVEQLVAQKEDDVVESFLRDVFTKLG
jgi:hypothetical protein